MASSAPARAGTLWPGELPALREIGAPWELYVPVSTDAASEAAAMPAGSRVRCGEAVNGGADESSAVPLAPLAGVVGDVQVISLTNGRTAQAVKLAVDADSAGAVDFAPTDMPETRGALAGWIERLRRLGVSANRHGCPDLISQLNSVLSRPVDTIICTVLDTDAALRFSAMLAAQSPGDVVAGVKLLLAITGARRAIIATEAYATALWSGGLRGEARSAGIRITELANDYPQADPTLIVFSLTNRRLRPSQLPTELGVVLVDAAAAMALGCAKRGQPMLRVPLGIRDHIRRVSHFIWAPVGTTLDHALAQCGIADEQIIVRAGDLLRDRRIGTDAVVAGGELEIHIAPQELPANPDPCIRSGWCIDICPTRVQPAKILEAAQHDSPATAIAAGIHACIECGLCSHVCPSRLPLLEGIRMMRAAENR